MTAVKQLAAVALGFVLACAIAAVYGADLTSAIVVGMFYTVPILFALILPWWGPAAMTAVVLAVMTVAGPSVATNQQDSVIASWAWLWVWVTLGVAITVVWTWLEQKRKARK
jgi:hypothetical protein